MSYEKNPLTPHLQIYKWQISSLLSITHRIVGVLNFLYIIMISLWIVSFNFSPEIFKYGVNFFSTSFGKFFILSLCWSFSFFILNEIRHLAWDLGYGFDLKISKITGYLTLIASFVFAFVIYWLGASIS